LPLALSLLIFLFLYSSTHYRGRQTIPLQGPTHTPPQNSYPPPPLRLPPQEMKELIEGHLRLNFTTNQEADEQMLLTLPTTLRRYEGGGGVCEEGARGGGGGREGGGAGRLCSGTCTLADTGRLTLKTHVITSSPCLQPPSGAGEGEGEVQG